METNKTQYKGTDSTTQSSLDKSSRALRFAVKCCGEGRNIPNKHGGIDWATLARWLFTTHL
jgi:hypothetical protein